MKLPDSFDFALTKAIKYQANGEHKEGQLLVLTAPNNKQHALRIKIKQAYSRAITSLHQSGFFANAEKAEPKEKESEEITGDAVSAVLYASEIDMVQLHDDFKRLICAGVCKVEDVEPMTAYIYEQLSCDDTDRLLGEYLAVFIK